MRYSFILPAYRRRHLAAAIESILAQTFKEFELVIVDDASPENLEEVVSRYSDARIFYYRHETNIGLKDLVKAWNAALEFAGGEYGILASDDDVYAPGFLEEIERLRAEYPALDLYHTRIAFIGDDGTAPCGYSQMRARFESPARFIYNRAALRLLQRAPEFVFKISSLRRMGGFVWMPRAWYSDDATWFTLAKMGGGVACSEKALLSWRSWGENITCRFDDADEKVIAARRFHQWLDVFLKGFDDAEPGDRLLIAKARKKATYEIIHLAVWVVRHAPLRAIIKSIRAAI